MIIISHNLKTRNGKKELSMKAIGYIRVSTQKQADEGVSLDAQRAKIEAWCLA
jgi:predicted site-specific integrase-resolvase